MVNKLSWAGMISGFVFSLYSGLRYWVIYPDEDKAIAYIVIGVLIMSVAYLYGEVTKLKERFEFFEEQVENKIK
jgi:CDP-diglyceride synthetase